MMKEPFRQIKILNETTGLGGINPLTSLNIAAVINSPTGPVDRVTIRSQTDLLNRFMSNSVFSPSDDITIQHLGALLANTPVDVIRVDSSLLREGVGSQGTQLIFDKNFNLLSKYTRLNFNPTPPLDIPVIYMAIGSNDAESVLYYYGDVESIPVEVSSLYDNKVDVTPDGVTTVSIDDFFAKINISAIANEYVPRVIKNSSKFAVILGEVEVVSPAISNIVIGDRTGDMWMVNFEAPSVGSSLVETGDYLQVGNYSLFNFGDGLFDDSILLNPIPIRTGDSGATNFNSFIIKCIDEITRNNYLPNLTGVSGIAQAILTGVEFTGIEMSDVLESLLAFEVNLDATPINTFSVAGSTELLEDQYVRFYIGSETYAAYVGEYNGPTVDNLIALDSKKVTPYGFVELLFEYFNTGAVPTVTAQLGCDILTLIYSNDVKPNVGFNFTNNIYQIVSDRELQSMLINTIAHATDEENISVYKYSGLWFKLDSTIFYTGTISEVAATMVKMYSGDVSMGEFLNYLYRFIPQYMNASGIDNGLIIEGEPVVDQSDEIILTKNQVVDQDVLTDRFAIVARFPSDGNNFKFKYIKNTDGSYDLTLVYNRVETDFVISFDPGAVDGFGSSIYYARINDGAGASSEFYIVELDGTEDYNLYESREFGSYLIQGTPVASDYVEALNKFREYDDKYYGLIWDAGYCSPMLARAMVTLAEEIHAQAVISSPASYKTRAQFEAYRDSVGSDSSQGIMVVPSYSSSVLGNFLSKLSCSLSYINLRVNNFNSTVEEFNPQFGPNKGLVTAPNLTTKFTKEDREAMLDKQINTVMVTRAGTQINMNRTMAKVNSYLSEDQNAYITNVISHVSDEYADTLIGYQSDPDLWEKIIRELTGRLTTRLITGKKPTVAGLRVLCDGDMNTLSIIESRQVVFEVWVQYNPSVAYALGYVKVKRLGSF